MVWMRNIPMWGEPVVTMKESLGGGDWAVRKFPALFHLNEKGRPMYEYLALLANAKFHANYCHSLWPKC